ncbi:hypothetical protein PF005_g8465 [Phytophthora fragariae]|uniref:Uncharacterized protein n=3 Tax=Phytophthora fragariae TaxID=53985 RepID=A0A6A4AIS9_9STRA|nr:hypothetical protein PF003_g15203 [Phytophthora fragariae]KAE8943662.1 hypothetical protein PF009_g6622 [Phytophthora fragariae]KAE9016082.1 hypothetical protein PF011_g7324 [Phytophthora fragariae]KAE9119007.1 hypothetical protein PF010_g8017 [Phytophthora fragariae]KAE9130374.1 hypothetical protein PF007_g4537 [Phytophthora fragariae]
MTLPPLLLSVQRSLQAPFQALPQVLHLVNEFLLPRAIDAAVYHKLDHVLQVYEAFRPYTVGAMDGAASMGLVDLVQHLHDRRTEGCSSRAFTGAAANNHLKVLKWLHEVYPEVSEPMEEIVEAARRGHHHVVEFLWSRFNGEELQRPLEAAAANGHVAVLEVLLPWTIIANGGAFTAAAANGHVPVLQFLLERDHVSVGGLESGLKQAVQCGQVKVVEFLLSVADKAALQTALQTAVTTGSTQIAELILKKYEADDTVLETVLTEAAKLDHCEMVQLLLDKIVPLGVSPAFDLKHPGRFVDLAMLSAVLEASRKGRVEMVKLLVTRGRLYAGSALQRAIASHQRGVVMLLLEICTAGQLMEDQLDPSLKNLLEKAVDRGDVEMVSLFTSKFGALDTGCALDLAVLHNHHEITETLAKRSKPAQKVNAFMTAAMSNNVEMAKVILEHSAQDVVERALAKVASSGVIEISKLLLEKCLPSSHQRIFMDAVAAYDVEVVKLLAGLVDQRIINRGLILAAARGHVGVVKALLDKTNSSTRKFALEAAAVEGRLSVIAFLRDRCDSASISNATERAKAVGFADAVALLSCKRARLE